MPRIVEKALQAVEWRAVGGAGGEEFVTARGKVQAAGSRGWVRRATPQFTGLLARSWRGKVTDDSITITTADIIGPRFPKSPNGPQKRVSEYASEVDAKRGIGEQLQRFMGRTFRRMMHKAIQARIKSEEGRMIDPRSVPAGE